MKVDLGKGKNGVSAIFNVYLPNISLGGLSFASVQTFRLFGKKFLNCCFCKSFETKCITVKSWPLTTHQGCQIFLVTLYQNGEKYIK
jgi:hypothetical protein